MSWAEEDWTVGLSGRVLQKVKELQVQHERFSRESRQRQLQLDNTQAALDKQTLKYEEARGEVQAMQRELQGVREEARAGVSALQRVSLELQTRQAQVCSLEGQLDTARTLAHNLTQEVKRLQAELEKLQNDSGLSDSGLFSTPCWNMTSAWEHSGGRKDERQGHRGEGASQALHVRQLQFSDTPTGLLPRQQNKSTLHRHHSNQSDSFSTPPATFPWEQCDSRPAGKVWPPPLPSTPTAAVISEHQQGQGDCGKAETLRRETDMCVAELRSRVRVLEGELRTEAEQLKASQEELDKCRKELTAREHNLQRSHDQLSLAHSRMAQESDRASGAEQRLRQLQEELKCQRQNTESSRLQHQQRTKDLEKQHQRDLLELQKERQCLQKQHQQEVNKLGQELQQARTLHNALQAHAEKVSLQKQTLDKEMETLKEKLKWTEGQVQESQKRDAQMQAKLMEALREAESVTASLEQSRRREKVLEEEGRRLAQEQADALQLIKELQDQKTIPTPSAPPLQVYAVEQSFSPQPFSSHHPRPSAHVKKPHAATQRGQGRENERGGKTFSKSPSDREPGEGIDSEHITALATPSSEHSRWAGRGGDEEEESKSRSSGDDLMGCNSPETQGCYSFDVALPQLSAAMGNVSEEKVSLKSRHHTEHEDLHKENTALRSELHDVREELQKRLEDLEGQRRAEAEARTRLKQLSRKHASQAGEREEQERERRAELERERAETERLRKATASLEAEVRSERKERERKERGGKEGGQEKASEGRESELMELNIQLKEQLAEVKAQLAIERGEREKEEEVRKCNLNFVKVRKKDLSIKLAELEAELEELKSRGKKDEEKRLPEANSPLAYLTFHDAEHNSSTDTSDNKLLSSPDQYRLFCESTNQHNTAVSQTAADIQEKKMEKVPEWQTTVEGQTGSLAFDLEDTTLKKHSGLSHLSGEPQRSISQPCDLDKELKCLREENAKEAERADQCQAKLEALQKQVTRETQQLTLAFERQSQHITDLLAELQEKESALLSQEGELQHCRQELAMLRAESEKQEKKGKKKDKRMAAGELEDVEQAEKKQECERGEEKPAEGGCYVQCYCSERATNNAVTINTLPEAAPTVPRDLAQPKMLASAAERQLATSNSQKASEEQADTEKLQSVALPQCFRDSDKSQNDQDKAHLMQTSHPKITYQDSGEHRQDSGTAHLVAELVSLQQENLQLKQRVQALTVLATTDPVNRPELQAISETQEISAEQNTDPGDEGTPTRSEERACSTNRPNNIITEEWQLTQQGGEKSKVIRTDEDRGIEAEEESHTVHKLQISLLEQQLVALQAELQALSEANQRQAEELTVWRLASQPIPAFDQNLTQTYNQSEIQDCTSALRCIQTPSFQKQTHYVTSDLSETQATLSTSCTQALKSTPGHGEQAALDVTQNSSTVTMVREDELILSCSSSRLHGHILATRLLQNNFPEPKSLLSSRKTSGPQNFIQHTAMVHEAFSEAFSDATKDPHAVSRPQTKDTKHPKGEPAAMPEAPRATSSLCTTVDSSGTERQGVPRNASTQTEEPPSPLTAPVPCKRHVHTQVEEEGEDEELADSLSVSPVSLPVAARFGDMALFSGSFPIPADPARLAERIRRNRSQLSAAFDDTEYEPYGLPEVVMKGFADIPSGPSCPYIVRRGLLGTAAVPLPNSETTQKEETD